MPNEQELTLWHYDKKTIHQANVMTKKAYNTIPTIVKFTDF